MCEALAGTGLEHLALFSPFPEQAGALLSVEGCGDQCGSGSSLSSSSTFAPLTCGHRAEGGLAGDVCLPGNMAPARGEQNNTGLLACNPDLLSLSVFPSPAKTRL